MSDVAIKSLSKGRDLGEMDELKKLILSEKARTKHLSDGASGGSGGRRVDGGDVSDDDEGEGDARERDGGRGRAGGAKEKKPKGTWRRGKLIISNDASDSNKYRDRAEERRKGQNPDYTDKLNQMASMDAETTKYLGGDIEHTHLVKGLDYALLVKIRDEERHRQAESSQGGVGDERDGERVERWREVRARTLTGKTVLAVLRRLNDGQGSGGPDFKRINYEFDLDAESLQEIPTAVAHSMGDDGDDEEDGDDGERNTNYLMEEGLLDRVQSAFTLFRQHGGRVRRHRKRARDKTGGGVRGEEDAIVAALAKSARASNDGNADMEVEGDGTDVPPQSRRPKFSINIFEDVDDRYVPPGSGASASAAGTTTPKVTTGYFSGLRVHKDGEDVKSSGEEMLPSRAEMSATVKAAARAAAARLAADKKPSSASAGGGGGGGGASARGPGMEGGGAKIERDIFAKRPSRGQALGVASGGYDVYPETGDFETYDSDEDTTNKKNAKPGLEGGLSGVGTDNPDKHPAFDKPKASFPFGIKKSEMSSRKPSGGKGRRMDEELNMIKKYMHGEK